MAEIKDYIIRLGLSFKEFKHPPVYTCEEAEKYNKDIKGVHSKNLFIKDKKSKRFYLVILPASKKLNMDNLGELLNDNIKFADEEDLKNILGLNKGAVSPFGLINDKENKVQIIIDKEVWNSKFVSFHPNINTETLELTKEDFHKFIKSLNNKVVII